MSALRWIRGLLLVSLLSGLLPNGGGSPVRADQEPGQPLKVDWSQATLSDGPRSVRSLRIEGAVQPEHPVEGGTLRVERRNKPDRTESLELRSERRSRLNSGRIRTA